MTNLAPWPTVTASSDVSVRMLRRLIIVAVMLVCGFASGESVAQDAIGTVSRIQGEASGMRNGANTGARAERFGLSQRGRLNRRNGAAGSHLHR